MELPSPGRAGITEVAMATAMQRFALVIPVLMLCAALPTAVRAQTGGCRPMGTVPDSHVTVQEPTVRYDFTQDASEIQQKAATSNPEMGSENYIVRGLTTTLFKWQLGLSFWGSPDASGHGYCIIPNVLELTLGYPDPLTVYVEDNYPESSCQHVAILEHENTHVAITRQSLDDHMPLIQAVARAAITNQHFPLWAPDMKTGENLILGRVQSNVTAAIQEMNDDRVARNAYLDRPESIAGTIAECPSW